LSTEPRFTPGDWVATRAARGGLYENSGVDLHEVGTKHARVAENCTKDDALLIAQAKKLLKSAESLLAEIQYLRKYVSGSMPPGHWLAVAAVEDEAESVIRRATGLREIHEPLGEHS
jgi:hypothetical protein